MNTVQGPCTGGYGEGVGNRARALYEGVGWEPYAEGAKAGALYRDTLSTETPIERHD